MPDPTERVSQAASAAVARGRIPLVDQFALDGNDNLRIILYSRIGASATAVVTWRWFSTRTQKVEVASRDLRGAMYPNAQTVDVRLEAGVLLNVRAVATNISGLFYGSTYVQCEIVRGLGGPVVSVATILQGYITRDNARGWPGSALQSMLEGPGAIRSEPFTETTGPPVARLVVFDACRWRIVSGVSVFTASAVAGNRNIVLGILDAGGNYLYRHPFPQTVIATATLIMTFGESTSQSSPTFGGWDVLQFPADVELPDSGEIELAVSSWQAGDAFSSSRALIREWLAI